MSPLVALHATAARHRPGIERYGLQCHAPVTNTRPYGVYVYSDSDDFDHSTRGSSPGAARVRWGASELSDVWAVSYIGPIVRDAYVENGLVLLESTQMVTLVTGNGEQ